MNAQRTMETKEMGAKVVDFFSLAVSGEADTQIHSPDVSYSELFGAAIPANFFKQIDNARKTVTGAHTLNSVNHSGKHLLGYYEELAHNLLQSQHPFAAPMETLVTWLRGSETSVDQNLQLDGIFSHFLSMALYDGQRVVTAPLGYTVVLPFPDEWTFVVQPVGLGKAKPNPSVDVDTSLNANSFFWKPCEPSAFAIFQHGIPIAATPQSLQRATAEALFSLNPREALKATIREYQMAMVRFQETLGAKYDEFHPMLESMTFSWVLAPMVLRKE